MPIEAVFDGRMSWYEADLLTHELAMDPSSHVGAALAGMKYPFSRTDFLLADMFDQDAVYNTDKKHRGRLKPYPRPVDTNSRNTHRSEKPRVDQARIRAELEKRHPQLTA